VRRREGGREGGGPDSLGLIGKRRDRMEEEDKEGGEGGREGGREGGGGGGGE